MFEKYCGQTTDTTSHTPEKLTPNLLNQLEYNQRTVYVEKYVKNVCELASESGSISTSNISSHGRADSTCESCSIPSEYTDYLLYVKERANIIRTNLRTDKPRHMEMYESEGSSVDSTGGLVNMRQDVTHLNMCDNPGDMWHGLKTLDGKPVVLHPLKGKHKSHKPSGFANNSGKKWPSLTKMLQTIRRKNNAPFDNSTSRKIVNSGDKTTMGANGPIDYSGGFLNINRYIKRGKNPTNSSNGTKFKRGSEVKYDFPIPQNIPPHGISHNSPNDSMNTQPRQNMVGKVILHKDRSRTGKAEIAEKIDIRYKLKTKQGRTKQLTVINVTTANTNNGPRAHRNKRRKTPRTDLDANA